MKFLETEMKRCYHVECGGKLQPHSLDSATGELDCDGPCSPRRVEAWKASLKQPTKTQPAKPKVTEIVVPSEYSHMSLEEYEAYLRSYLWES